jgi:hypothetical protein
MLWPDLQGEARGEPGTKRRKRRGREDAHGGAAVIEELPFFWVVTSAGEGGANARIVNAQPGKAAEDF